MVYSHTTIDYGRLHRAGFDLIDGGTPDLSINVHLDAPVPLREVNVEITAGDTDE